MSEPKIQLFAWLLMISVINIGLVFIASTDQTDLGSRIYEDLGVELYGVFGDDIIDSNGDIKGLAFITGASSHEDFGNTQFSSASSLKITDEDTNMGHKKDESGLDFLEGLMNIGHYLSRAKGVLDLIAFSLFAGAGYIFLYSEGFVIWAYIIYLPLLINGLRIGFKLILGSRVD